MTIRVLHPHQEATKLPFTWTVVIGLLLDRLHAPDWLWGVIGTLMVALWALLLWRIRVEEHVKIDLDKPEP